MDSIPPSPRLKSPLKTLAELSRQLALQLGTVATREVKPSSSVPVARTDGQSPDRQVAAARRNAEAPQPDVAGVGGVASGAPLRSASGSTVYGCRTAFPLEGGLHSYTSTTRPKKLNAASEPCRPVRACVQFPRPKCG